MARGEQAKDGQICRLEPLPTLRHDHHRAGHCLPRPHAPSELYADLTRELGAPAYARVDAPVTADEKAALLAFSPADVGASELAGQPTEAVLTKAPGNNAPIGGLKVVTAQGWFAVRPSGTEDVYKLYAESFRGIDHLQRIQKEAQAITRAALRSEPARTATR